MVEVVELAELFAVCARGVASCHAPAGTVTSVPPGGGGAELQRPGFVDSTQKTERLQDVRPEEADAERLRFLNLNNDRFWLGELGGS